jgi:hypothetical protein
MGINNTMNIYLLLARNVIQISTFIILIFCIIILQMWSRRNITRKLWSVPALILIIHICIFYGVIFFDEFFFDVFPSTLPIFSTWSSALRLHTAITFASIIITLNNLNGKLEKSHDPKRHI